MAQRKGNGKFEQEPVDVEHELPAAEDDDSSADEGRPVEAQMGGAAVAVTEADYERLKAERDQLLDRLARLQAEFENTRKRMQRDQQEYREYAAANAIQALLPILDSFDRALESKTATVEEFHAGMELIDRQLHDALAKLGVRPVPAEGQPFDPRVHQAVQVVDTTEAPDNHVLEELQRGYTMKDRLLRPAMVRVARTSKS